jgi:Tfp pilus assembly protein PilO
MNPQLRNQILIGASVGLVIAAATYFLLGGKRDELQAAQAAIESLQKDVDKGNQLKANAKKLEEEVNQQKKRIEELVRMMPSDADRGDIPLRIKKLADAAGIDVSSWSFEKENAQNQYYIEYPVKFEFRAGYHSFGQFTSLLSGYDKIINLTDLGMKSAEGRSVFPVRVTCKISAFVYKPEPPAAQADPAAPAGKAATPKPAAADKGE